LKFVAKWEWGGGQNGNGEEGGRIIAFSPLSKNATDTAFVDVNVIA
jgi:hypothetical protein